jgi:hypothetical protein
MLRLLVTAFRPLAKCMYKAAMRQNCHCSLVLVLKDVVLQVLAQALRADVQLFE